MTKRYALVGVDGESADWLTISWARAESRASALLKLAKCVEVYRTVFTQDSSVVLALDELRAIWPEWEEE